ncbi:hypothetical protein AAY473_002304 [Plecturocebus cupreus]
MPLPPKLECNGMILPH